MIPQPLRRAAVLALLALGAAPGTLWAQDFPSRPIRLVVPFAPGGSTDIIARSVGQKMAERLGQPVVIDNKPGAATTIGTEFVARAAPDGHTLLLAPVPFVTAQYTFAKLGYDSRRDFAPISLLLNIPLVVAVNPARTEARTLPALIASMKAQPGKMSMGSPGTGSHSHLAFELFRLQTGVDALHVPYKGAAPVIADLLGGQIDFTFTGPMEVLPHVRSGKLAILGVAAPQRLSYLPTSPTMRESGLSDYEASFWFGIVAPAATPKDVVAKLHDAVAAALKSPEVVEALSAQGAEIAASSPEAFARFLQAEHARWSNTIRTARITLN
jgi:tripartite-type tricarboxylate transporter receptor subunit TctC